ncbi:hypothetical protein AB0D14_31750 [Streptomyces sp. NPDC048484]|uniref:hypothetical protein n=1 Tax=Streptomyces sp. NPDC048484 TaxID=3155146 RepID=UPI003442F521
MTGDDRESLERRHTVMLRKVLVAYGTTNGSTARIAETVAEVLRTEEVSAEAVPARSVQRAMARLDAREHVTFGGCLEGTVRAAEIPICLRPD